jgi:hypothetical protein
VVEEVVMLGGELGCFFAAGVAFFKLDWCNVADIKCC